MFKLPNIYRDYDDFPVMGIHWDGPDRLRAFYATGRKEGTLYTIDRDAVRTKKMYKLPKDYKKFLEVGCFCVSRFIMLGIEMQTKAMAFVLKHKRPRNRYIDEYGVYLVNVGFDGYHILLYKEGNYDIHQKTLYVGDGAFCSIDELYEISDSWLGVVDDHVFHSLKQMQREYCRKVMKLLEIEENLMYTIGKSIWHVDINTEEKDASSKFDYPNVWSAYGEFEGCLASVADKEGHWGFIDLHGNLVIPCQWKSVDSFGNYYATIAENDEGKFGLIDRHGKIVAPFKWDSKSDDLWKELHEYCNRLMKRDARNMRKKTSKKIGAFRKKR